MQYVSVGRRLVAALVDGSIAFFGFGFLVASLSGAAIRTPNGVEFNLEGSAALALFALCLAYFVGLEAIFGTTIGKALVGLRVRTTAGDRIGLGAAFVRNLLRVVDVCFGCVGAVLIWASPRRQRLGDRVAGTVVVLRA